MKYQHEFSVEFNLTQINFYRKTSDRDIEEIWTNTGRILLLKTDNSFVVFAKNNNRY